MKLEEFKQLLKESGLPQEFSLKLDQIIRAINDQENRLNILETKITYKADKKFE